MSLNVGDSNLDIIRREAEKAGNLIIAPTLLEVIHHIVYRDARPLDFWSTAAVDDLCAHYLLSC